MNAKLFFSNHNHCGLWDIRLMFTKLIAGQFSNLPLSDGVTSQFNEGM